MAQSRRELATKFRQEIYLQASFFKMKTTGSASMDSAANKSVSPLLCAMPHPHMVEKYVPSRETWHKTKADRNSMRIKPMVETHSIPELTGFTANYVYITLDHKSICFDGEVDYITLESKDDSLLFEVDLNQPAMKIAYATIDTHLGEKRLVITETNGTENTFKFLGELENLKVEKVTI